MLTVSTVNVNGIRAAARKGFTDWLRATDADVVCLQEVRATPEEWPAELTEIEGWHRLTAPAALKGRAGVAVLSRVEPVSHRIGFGSAEFDDSGRYVQADLPGGVSVGSLYLPSGETGTARQDEKERFLKEFYTFLSTAKTEAEASGRHLVVCGDWNIAHREIDLKNWKTNRKTAGFLPEEREWMSTVFDEAGYVDVHRALQPEGPGPYTWWSVRGRAFDNDAGWRLDYHVATPGLAATAVHVGVERAATHDLRWSDHAPVTVRYEI